MCVCACMKYANFICTFSFWVRYVYMTKDMYPLFFCFFGWVHNTKHACQNDVSILTLTHAFNFAYFVSNNTTVSNTC